MGIVGASTTIKLPTIMDDWSDHFSHDDEKEVYAHWKQNLHQLSAKIDDRNKTRKWLFEDFNPKHVTCSISS